MQTSFLVVESLLELKGCADLPPALGHMGRVTCSGDTLRLHAATAGDLAPFVHLALETDSAIVRAEYSPASVTTKFTHILGRD